MLDGKFKNLAKEMAKYIKEDKPKTSSYDTQAVVRRVEGNTAYVHIPGGIDETPVNKTIAAQKGDTVQVRVSGKKAFLVGNASAPPTDDRVANIATTKAVKAQDTADNAEKVADMAIENAQIAAESAASAQENAQIAKDAADAAQADANTANGILNDMEDAATAASTTLTGIYADAETAKTNAQSALTNAGLAQTAADNAQASADNASEYASRALGNLSTVQSVSETLTWITQHGTMASTQDQHLDPTHVYFVVDAQGDYVVGGTHYSIVAEPDEDDLSTYYELSINESLNNYVGTHLALDSEGLWLLPATSGTNKVLIATGAGSTYTSAGTYLIDGSGNVVASFRANGATIGIDDTSHGRVKIDANTLKLISKSITGSYSQLQLQSNGVVVGYYDGSLISGQIINGQGFGTKLYNRKEVLNSSSILDYFVSAVLDKYGFFITHDRGTRPEAGQTNYVVTTELEDGYLKVGEADSNGAFLGYTVIYPPSRDGNPVLRALDSQDTPLLDAVYDEANNIISLMLTGSITAGGDIWSDGKIEADGDMNCNGNISTGGTITSTGDIESLNGNITAAGDVTDGNGTTLAAVNATANSAEATADAAEAALQNKQDKLTSSTDITVKSVTIGDHATPIGTNGTTTNTSGTRGNSTSYAGIGLQVSLPKGVWMLTGTITFASNTTGRRAVRLTDAGTAIACSEVVSPPANGAATALHTSAVVENTTSSNKTYAMQCYQNSGSTQNVTGELRYVRIA